MLEGAEAVGRGGGSWFLGALARRRRGGCSLRRLRSGAKASISRCLTRHRRPRLGLAGRVVGPAHRPKRGLPHLRASLLYNQRPTVVYLLSRFLKRREAAADDRRRLSLPSTASISFPSTGVPARQRDGRWHCSLFGCPGAGRVRRHRRHARPAPASLRRGASEPPSDPAGLLGVCVCVLACGSPLASRKC